MLEVVICDDDKEDLDKATLMLDKILSEYQVQYQIRSFLSANELLNSNDKIDIGILDISMEELGGITLGRKLKEKNHDIKIIYITSYEEYMAQAINKVHAFSFLCKPINEEEMKTQIMEILGQEKYPEIEKEFEILDESGTKAGCVCLKLNEILYFEYIKRSRKVLIALSDITYEYDCIFEKLVEELQPYDFVVNCRGNLVNLRHIEKIKGFIIYMDNGKELQIAQKRSSDFREEVNKFLQKNS